MGEIGEENRELKRSLEKLSRAEEFDNSLMKRIKNICKKGDDHVEFAQKVLLSLLQKKHCVVRLNCVLIIDELFQRSHHFRDLLLEDFQAFVDFTLGSDPSKPLPPPVSQNKKLRTESIRKIKHWFLKFGDGYKKLRLSYNVLKQTVDFDEMCLINDESRLARREREERLQRLWDQRVNQVSEEVAEYEPDIQEWLMRTGNLLEAVTDVSAMTNYSEEISGQQSILVKRFLPKSKAWLSTLTKAGRSVNQDLLSRVIEIKNRLESSLDKFEAMSFKPQAQKAEKGDSLVNNSKVDSKNHEDPTTWHATVKKVTGQNFDLNIQLEDRNRSVDRSTERQMPGTSGLNNVPTVKLKNLQEPDKMVVDPEKSRFWVSDHREGEVLTMGSTRIVSEFSGSMQPIKWTCRAKMSNGMLCPRMDRFKCPLHGVIVARNEQGEVTSDRKVNQTIPPTQTRPKVKRKGMKSASKWDETSRSRIEKKIFNKSSALRVAKDQKIYDKIRTKDKFVDQFNY